MRKTTRVFLGVIAVFVLGLGWLVRQAIDDVEQRYRESAEELLVDTAQLLAALLAADLQHGAPSVQRLRQAMPALQRSRFEARIFAAVKRDVNLTVYVTDAAGRVLYHSQGQHEGEDFSRWNDVLRTLQGQYGARSTRAIADRPDTSTMYVAAPILNQGQLIGVVSVGKPTSSYRPFVEAARRNLLIGGATSGLAVVLLALAVALWLVRPVGLFSDYLQLLKNRRQAGLPRLGRSALGLLGAAFDEMRDALAGRSYVEEYVQALTHEIKSPLSAIRAAAELLDEELPAAQHRRFLSHIREEGGRIQDIVDRLLELSSLEKRRGLAQVQRIELAPLLGEAMASLSSSAAARGIVLRCDVPPQCYVEGDRFLLLRALDNLLQNAVQFSPPGGEIEVGLESSQRHHQIAIRDQGPGIPEYAVKRVFERFYSLPRPHSGKKSTGLGLSFVQEIAELHHGQVSLANHSQGGALAVLRLRKA